MMATNSGAYKMCAHTAVGRFVNCMLTLGKASRNRKLLFFSTNFPETIRLFGFLLIVLPAFPRLLVAARVAAVESGTAAHGCLFHHP